MSDHNPIPPWDPHGILPPIRPDEDPASFDRSPYRASPLALCERFGSTPERRTILRGLFALRAALRAFGYDTGFQWVNGSFTEEVERTGNRPPNDVDVVTWAPRGSREQQTRLVQEARNLIDPDLAKHHFKVDHYFKALDQPLSAAKVREITYWYSLWAHRRGDLRWKGFVVLALDEDDEPAHSWLARQDGDTPTGEEVNDERP